MVVVNKKESNHVRICIDPTDLNKDQIGQREVKRVNVIINMREPKDVKKLESVLGMVAYVAKFIPKLSELTEPPEVIEK